MSKFQQKHPLQNPLILQITLDHLSKDDLLSCSQVCKLWKSEANRFLGLHVFFEYLLRRKQIQQLGICRLVSQTWRRRVDLVFQANLDFVLRIHAKNFNYGCCFEENCIKARCENFALKFNGVTKDGLSKNLQFTRRWGSHLKILHLVHSGWSCEILRQMLFEDLPNLEELRIICGKKEKCDLQRPQQITQQTFHRLLRKEDSVKTLSKLTRFEVFLEMPLRIEIVDEALKSCYHENNHNQFGYALISAPELREFLEDILQNAPNLQMVHVTSLGRGYDDSSFHHRLCKCKLSDEIVHWYLLNGIIHPKTSLPKLEFIESSVNRFYKPTDLVQIQLKNFPLRKFSFEIYDPEFDTEILYGFILSLGNTLESISLAFHIPKNPTPTVSAAAIEFPTCVAKDLRKLTSLSLSGVLYKRYDFLVCLVQLKELYLTRVNLEDVSFELNLNSSAETLFPNLDSLFLKKCAGDFLPPFKKIFEKLVKF